MQSLGTFWRLIALRDKRTLLLKYFDSRNLKTFGDIKVICRIINSDVIAYGTGVSLIFTISYSSLFAFQLPLKNYFVKVSFAAGDPNMNPSERCGIVVFRNEVPCLGSYSNGHSSCATECERINHGLEYDERFIRLHDAISKGFKMVLDKLRSEDSESEDSDEQKDEDNAPNLTVRIWAEILTNLNATQLANARLVCHRWKRIIDRSPSLVGKFVLSFPHGTTLDKHCELVRDVIASGMQHTQASLRKITLVGAAAWWPAVGGALISLNIADCKIPIDMLLDVLKLSPSLKRLDLTCGKNLYFHTVKAVDFQLETLENLCLTDIQYVKTLDVFQQMCPRLKVLRIPGRSKLAGFIDKLICFIKATRRTLEEVAIGGGTDLWEKLSDLNGLLLKRATFSYVAPERMVILSRNVPSIESLSIDWMKFEDEVSF